MKKQKDHARLAKDFNRDEERVDWHDETLWLVRQKRDRASREIPDWEKLRDLASSIKEHTLASLDQHLQQFESVASLNGVRVHWAVDAEEHNRIILDIIRENKVKRIVKSKSMLTEECNLNSFLVAQGINVLDTDLGEWIVQLREEHPSHIVLPAIHLKKEDVSETFHGYLATEKGNIDPKYLTSAARTHLRPKFLEADLSITGVNFAVAETGGIVICTNEGNADMGCHAAPIHIACMGIEKIIPEQAHLGVFLRLLARSATGQPITTYSSHIYRPRPGQQLHVVILDNGRTAQLARPDFRNSLKCIRCAACFNTCPVYRKSGGHSYHNTTAGPIGAILNPNNDMRRNADLPFASTLCGSCSNVCPVKIDIHQQLWKWRQVLVNEGYTSKVKKSVFSVVAWVLAHPVYYRLSGRLGRWIMRSLPVLFKNKTLNPWYRDRDMPAAPDLSFRDWYKSNRK